MTHRDARFGLVEACVALFFVAGLWVVAMAGDAEPADGMIASPEKGWPQFRGPRRDGISTETGLLKNWPAVGPKLLWKIGEIGRGWSSPIGVGDSLFINGDVAGECTIFCLNLKGEITWKAVNGAAWTKHYPGARASCVFSEGVLYHLNSYGRVAALEAATGKELWTLNILKQFEGQNIIWGLSECLLVDGPRLIVTPGGTAALMAALNKKTGKTVWTTPAIPGDKAAYASPILFRMANRRVISSNSSRNGFGVDAETGKLLWNVAVVNPHGATCCSPVYANGAVFYAVPDGPAGVQFALKTNAESIVPELAWKTPVDTLTGGGIFKDGILYANGCKKSTSLHALDWRTGESRYEIKISKPANGHATSALVWADGRIYCLFENGIVSMLKPDATAFDAAGQFQLVDAVKSDAWAHPVILDGRMYLRYHDTLWCYDIKNP